MTINKILELIKEEGLKGVNEVIIANIWDIDTVAVEYPMMLIDPNQRSHIFQPGMTTYSLDLYIVDIVRSFKKDNKMIDRPILAEILNIESDMVEIMAHFVDHMESKFDGFRIKKDQNNQLAFRMFSDRFNDNVAGVKIEVSLIIATDKKCINRFNG
jgi:hypothetical protein